LRIATPARCRQHANDVRPKETLETHVLSGPFAISLALERRFAQSIHRIEMGRSNDRVRVGHCGVAM
jgi:hypothetical protein